MAVCLVDLTGRAAVQKQGNWQQHTGVAPCTTVTAEWMDRLVGPASGIALEVSEVLAPSLFGGLYVKNQER